MNDRKICFIMCVNNWQYANEAVYYINHLNIPVGYELDLLTVENAKSITSAYNEAMRASDAKYKVYFHQDVMIIEPDFLNYILKIFENPQIGMLGVWGAKNLAENAIVWDSIGKIYTSNIYTMKELKGMDIKSYYELVDAVDGMLMVTQYDLPWREDVFTGWHFYDISQSLEFRNAGYQVVVPQMQKPWCIHDDGYSDLEHYEEERKKFLKEYYGVSK